MTSDNEGMSASDARPLAGFRIGVTAARKVEEQTALLERRGATVVWAPALSLNPNHVDDDSLRAATEDVLSRPVDVFLATTGIGIKAWFAAAESWGLLDDLLAALGAAEILARGPKSVGALRRRGLQELWAPESEAFEDVLEHLRGRDLTGQRIVVQEHGQSLSMAAHALRRQGADVTTVSVYRVLSADDPGPMFHLIDQVADRELHAVTFTSAPAIAALMEAAGSTGRRDELVGAFQADVVASCVGPVTAAAFEMWGVPSIFPDRSRLAAMIKQLETELPARASGLSFAVAGHTLLVPSDSGGVVFVDGIEARLSPAPFAVLQALLVNPGHVVSRRQLLAALPSGTAGSEHAVEMAVARLRAAPRHPRRADRGQARLPAGGGVLMLVTVAHGTRHAPGNAVAAEITAAAGERLALPAVASYVELCDPSFASVMAALERAGGRGAAAALDRLPRARRPAGGGGRASVAVGLGRPLGPDPLLARAQAERLREAGADPGPPGGDDRRRLVRPAGHARPGGRRRAAGAGVGRRRCGWPRSPRSAIGPPRWCGRATWCRRTCCPAATSPTAPAARPSTAGPRSWPT